MRTVWVTVACLMIAGSASARGRQTEPYPNRRITVSMRETPLRSALGLLFQGSGANFAVEPEVRDVVVTLSLQDADFRTALRQLLRVAGTASGQQLIYRYGDGVFMISVAGAERGPEQAPLEILKIVLQHLRVEEFAGRLSGSMLPPTIQTTTLPADNSLIVQGSAEDIERLKRFIRLLDVPTSGVALRAGVAGPGANGRAFRIQSAASTMSGRDVLIDEHVASRGARTRLRVRLKPFMQGDGTILIDSDWQIMVPVAGGAGGPVQFVKTLVTTTRVTPGKETIVAEVDTAGWGGKGLLRLWIRAGPTVAGGLESAGFAAPPATKRRRPR